MPKLSAGLLLYRYANGQLQVLLVHPGGPFWPAKDEGAWSVPKGEYATGEDPLTAAKREFEEETGSPAPADAEYIALTPLKQPSGKIVSAWAVEADFDPSTLRSNTFSTEWPPHSGKTRNFPEVDRAQWFTIPEATLKIHKGQLPLLEELTQALAT